MKQCEVCENIPEDNDEIFYDVSYSDSGLDDSSRIDEVICKNCIDVWIEDKTWDKINLIRRIKNPTCEGD